MNNGKRKFLSDPAFKFLIFIGIIVILAAIGNSLHIDLQHYRDKLRAYPFFLSGIIYIFSYVFFTMLIWLGPKDFFRVSGALLFGPLISTVLVSSAEMINALILFSLSRKLGHDFVKARFNIKSHDLSRVKDRSSILNIFALRINPLIPYRFLDIAYGLTDVPFRRYFYVILFATPLRVLWQQVIIAGVGVAVFDIGEVVNYFLNNVQQLVFCLLYVVFVVMVSLIALWLKLRNKSKAEN